MCVSPTLLNNTRKRTAPLSHNPDHNHGNRLSSKLLASLPALCNIVRRIALEAGEITLDYFDGGAKADLSIDQKSDGSPVTLADRETEAFIVAKLQELTPDVPVVGEEMVAAGHMPDISGARYFWLVDALDGTKEFIAGNEDFTVNIALIEHGKPVMGVVYLPATGILYAGHEAGSAIKWNDDARSEKPVSVRKPPADGLIVMCSRHHNDEARLDAFLADFKIKRRIARGSSMKICAIAEGKADLYPRLGPTCEWDIAAAHAVLNAAGGVLTGLDGEEFTYGHAERAMLNPEFVAASVNWFESDEEE